MEKKTSKNILLIIMGMLILAELIATIIAANEYGRFSFLVTCKIVSLAFIALYGFWLYKKPHGNMLKFAMLILAIAQMAIYSRCLKTGIISEYKNIISMISSAILIYVAGRLNRIEQNKYLLLVAFIPELISSILSMIQGANAVDSVTLITYLFEPVAILTLIIAYFVRYKQHQEAGLMDAPKK